MAELADTLVPTEEDRLEQAEAAVRAYCRWHIAPSRTETLTVRGNALATVILLPSLYVTAVASVTADGVLLADTDYSWTTAGVLTRVDARWTESEIVVVFTHGYIDAPADVTGVVQATAQRFITGGSVVQVGAVRFGEGSSDRDEVAVLNQYRIPSRT